MHPIGEPEIEIRPKTGAPTQRQRHGDVSESTKRSLATILAFVLSAVIGGMFVILAWTLKWAPEQAKDVMAFLQPLAIVALTGLVGLGAVIGIKAGDK